MNIAFPALVIILLVLPGILASYAYRKGSWRSPVVLGPFQNELATGLIWALLLNGLALALIAWAPWWRVDYAAFLTMVTGWPPVREEIILTHINAVALSPFWILAYLLALNVSGVAIGYGLHVLVRRKKLDLRYDLLRFNNEWYYLFSGEARIFDVPQDKRRIKSIISLLSTPLDLVWVSVVVQQGGRAILYSGVLADFYFSSAGVLDRIILERAQRRDLARDRLAEDDEAEDTTPEESARFYPVRGQYLVLPVENATNLNIVYRLYTENRAEAEADVEPSLSALDESE